MSLSYSIDEMKTNKNALAKAQKDSPYCWCLELEYLRPRCYKSHTCTFKWNRPYMENISWECDVSSPKISMVNDLLHSVHSGDLCGSSCQ